MIDIIKTLIKWVRVTDPGDNKDQFYNQKVEYLGKQGKAIILFPYGIHANVPGDNLALAFAAQGNEDNRACIPIDAKSRPELLAGEVAIYHPVNQSIIKFSGSGDIDITTNGSVTITGNVSITGDLSIAGGVTNNGSDIGETHGHTQDPDSNGDTQAPISGVT